MKQSRLFASVLLVNLLLTVALPAQEMWQATQIRVSLTPFEGLWPQLEMSLIEQRATAEALQEEGEGFATKPMSELLFYAPGGDFEVFTGGIIYADGGYLLQYKDQQMSLMDFEVRTVPNSFHLDIYGPDNLRWFIVTHAHTYAKPGTQKLTYKHGDLTLAPELTKRLGREILTGQVVGIFEMEVTLDQPIVAIERGDCIGEFEGDVDVALIDLSGPSHLYPTIVTDKVLLSASAKLGNNGTADVPWYRSIAPDEPVGQHPYLVQHFYVEHQGILRTLGQSDVKHAFFSVNTDCNCAGGNILYVGCTDTYGATTNTQQYYLAPRDEINAFNGSWKSTGSHFDGTPVDNSRDHGGSADHPDRSTHCLTVDGEQLDLDGARYLMEGWYVVKDDINIDNSFAYREVDPIFNLTQWAFANVSGSINGPAITGWFAQGTPNTTSERIDTGAGQIHISSKVTDLGDNRYRYAYAIMNIDYMPGVNQVEISTLDVLSGVTTQFFDADSQVENDWNIAVTENRVTFDDGGANPVRWGSLYTFVVDTQSEPVEGQIDVQLGGLVAQNLKVRAMTPGDSCLDGLALGNASVNWETELDVRDLVVITNDLCVFN